MMHGDTGGGSLLTEPVLCRPDMSSQKVCGLPGACIWDMTERLLGFINSRDHYSFHKGTNEAARSNLERLSRDDES